MYEKCGLIEAPGKAIDSRAVTTQTLDEVIAEASRILTRRLTGQVATLRGSHPGFVAAFDQASVLEGRRAADSTPQGDEADVPLRNTAAAPNADGTNPVLGEAFATFTIANADPSGVTSNSLKITRNYLGEVEETTYTHDTSTDQWQLNRPYDNRIENLAKSTLPNGDKVETRTVTDSNGVVLSKVAQTYRLLTIGRRMITQVVDPDGKALTTSWEYYDTKTTDGQAYGEIKSTTDPYGNWTRYEYARNDSNTDVFRDWLVRPVKVVSQFLDQPISSANSLNRVVETSINPAGVPAPSEMIVEKLLGQEISRRYLLKYPGVIANLPVAGVEANETHNIVCVTPGAAWNTPGNLVTKEKVHTSGEYSGEVIHQKHPDGTMSLYARTSNATGDITTVETVGEPNANGTSVVAGTRTETLRSRSGHVLSEMRSDIVSGLVLSTSIASTVDQFGRPTKITYQDGSTVVRTYDCCGLSSEINQYGVSTIYTHSPCVTTRSSLGVMQKETESGRIAISERIPLAGGAAIEQSLGERNIAGELISTQTAGNRVTTMSTSTNGDGRKVVTTTLPDSSTRVVIYHKDGQLLQNSGTGTRRSRFEYGVGSTPGATGLQRFTTAYVVDAAGADTGEWQRSWTDALGRTWKQESSSGATQVSTYNTLGQMTQTTDADGVTTLTAYNGKGQATHTALDLNQNGVIDFAGPDRINAVNSTVAIKNGQVVTQSTSSLWRDGGEEIISTREQSADGLQSWSTVAGITTHQQTVIAGNGAWTITQTNGDGSKSIQSFVGGRLASEQFQKADGTVLSGTTYLWDAHGRLSSQTDARNGTTTMVWRDSDELTRVTTPAPGLGGGAAQTTSYTYDAMGRNDITTLPDGTAVDTDYYPTGEVKKVSGSRTYTREYGYDAAGRQISLVTNPGTPEQQLTEWIFHPVTGRLEAKKIAGATVASFTYTAGGRVLTKTGGRNITATYGYNSAGQVQSVAYSDGLTPGAAFTYRRSGEVHTVTHAGSTYTYDYGLPGELEATTITGGILDGTVIDPAYDALHRRSALSVNGNGTAVINQTWAYEPGSSRLHSVSQGAASATYSYVANSSLIDNITHSSGGVNRLTSTRVYDNLNRLRSITSLSTAAANAVAKSFTYTYNTANQRTRVDREDTTNWNYGYDALGHVTSATKKLADNSPLAGHQFSYNYDGLGNRQSATFGGDSTGTAGFHTTSYTANEAGDRNQYSSVSTPGVVLSTGKANATASVTINGQPAQDRQGDHFAHQNAVPNETAAQLFDLTVVATDGVNTNTVNRKELVPIQTATQTHDADGNLTFDGYRDYTWDAENRLLSVQTRANLVPAGGSGTRVEYAYDYLSRRILRHAQQKLGNAWYTISQTKYIYDGWNVIAELGGTLARTEIVQSYLWGLDLSGSAQGAGGVGGLLSIQKHTGANAGVHFAAYDGNGNVAALANADDGTLSASYEYDAFGNLLEMSGVFGAANSYRFSTKPWDEDSALYYYGYRYYDPTMGRWLNRDPIAEAGGVNLYGFVGNIGIGKMDVLGLKKCNAYVLIGHNSNVLRRAEELAKEDNNFECSYIAAIACRGEEGDDNIRNTLENRYGTEALIPDFPAFPQFCHRLKKPEGIGVMMEQISSDQAKQLDHFSAPDWVTDADWTKAEGWEQWRYTIEDVFRKGDAGATHLCECNCDCTSVSLIIEIVDDSPYTLKHLKEDLEGREYPGRPKGYYPVCNLV